MDGGRFISDVFPERNLNIWTTTVCGYAHNFRSDEALVLFDQMLAEGHEPNAATPTRALVVGLCSSGLFGIGRKKSCFYERIGD